jgi:hypothetical protein
LASRPGFAIVGRHDERRTLTDPVEQAGSGPAALVVEGEAGIGKTVVWRDAIEAAAALDHHVLRCRPSEAESHLAYAAFGDLLADVPADVLAVLPAPQRQAIDVAMFRAAPGDEPIPERAVGLALLGVMRHLASERPVLVGVDDAQWLDGPTERALSFATRRLVDEPVVVLATRRLGAAAGFPAATDHAFAGGVVTMRLGPLPALDLETILSARFGSSLATADISPLERIASGNPFFALELAGALVARGDTDRTGDELPVPASLQRLVGERLDRMRSESIGVVETAAIAARPSEELLARVFGPAAAAEAVRDYGFNVETAGDHPAWHVSEVDVLPGHHADPADRPVTRLPQSASRERMASGGRT